MYNPNNIRLMEIICFERKAFEEFAMKIERFIRLVSDLPHLKDAGKTAGWLDHCDVCRKLKISKRTLQTLRDNGTLAYTKIGNRITCRKTWSVSSRKLRTGAGKPGAGGGRSEG